jgi:hypothetical protein
LDTPANTIKQGVEEKKVEPPTAFDRLVLEEGHKPMIISLIAQHFRDKESKTSHQEQFDIVKGKGKRPCLSKNHTRRMRVTMQQERA